MWVKNEWAWKLLIKEAHFSKPMILKNWFISKLVDQIFNESLPRARKERQIASRMTFLPGP